MDINHIRIGVTLVSLILFLMLIKQAYSRKHKMAHEEASMLIFAPETLNSQQICTCSTHSKPSPQPTGKIGSPV